MVGSNLVGTQPGDMVSEGSYSLDLFSAPDVVGSNLVGTQPGDMVSGKISANSPCG